MSEIKEIFGQTGEVGRDGLLSPEQLLQLEKIQENAANSVFKKIQDLQKGDLYPTVAMATGIGKGRIIHKVIEKQLRHKPDSKILVIAGTKLELVKQTHVALAEHSRRSQITETEEYFESEDSDLQTEGEAVSLNGGSLLYTTGQYRSNANIQVTTMQTIQSEQQKGTLAPEEYDLVIVDEVHNAGTQKRYEALQRFDKVIGFTATPRRHTGRMKDPEDYGFSMVDSLTLPEAQDVRLLPPLCGVQIDTKDLVAEIPTNSFGQIDFKKLEKLLKESPDLRPYIADRIANIISSEGRQYKTVIAVNFVWEAQELAQLLKDKGISVGVAVNKQSAKEIHSEEIPALDAIERYKLPASDEKSIQVLISPYVASEGFDAPFTEVLVWASPTDSPLRYTQYTGRLARRANGKLFGVVIDCLYQTSQYGWSYNFGMWMKGNVRQLDNGLLWLGPETDIEGLKDLPALAILREQADIKPLSEMEQGRNILEVQQTDFAISRISLQEYFVNGQTYLESANDLIMQLKERDPQLVARRKSGNFIISAVTDRLLFITEMKKRYPELQERDSLSDILEVQATDVVISQPFLQANYVNGQTWYSLAREVTEALRIEDPSLVKRRKIALRYVDVVVDKARFIKEMRKRFPDFEEKDPLVLEVQPTDFVVSKRSLYQYFINGDRLLNQAIEIMELLHLEDANLVTKRRVSHKFSRNVDVIVDRNRFINEMVKRGAKLKEQKTS